MPRTTYPLLPPTTLCATASKPPLWLLLLLWSGLLSLALTTLPGLPSRKRPPSALALIGYSLTTAVPLTYVRYRQQDHDWIWPLASWALGSVVLIVLGLRLWRGWDGRRCRVCGERELEDWVRFCPECGVRDPVVGGVEGGEKGALLAGCQYNETG